MARQSTKGNQDARSSGAGAPPADRRPAGPPAGGRQRAVSSTECHMALRATKCNEDAWSSGAGALARDRRPRRSTGRRPAGVSVFNGVPHGPAGHQR